MSYRLIDNETNEDIIDKLGRIKDERDKYKIALDKIKEYIKEKVGTEIHDMMYVIDVSDILELLEKIK